MKKLSCLFLSLFLISSIMMGCGKTEEGYEILIKKLIAPETYASIKEDYPAEEYYEVLKKRFGEILNEEGFNSLAMPNVPIMYNDVINDKKITAVKDLKISDVKEDDKGDYTYVSCNVTYSYIIADGESIDMKESFAFHVNKDDKIIENVWCDMKNNSIYKLRWTGKS
ncbi:MAG: hypothetical protein RSB70_04785 [Clostridium sp.]